ncbi:MAG: hypothetical protein WD623_00705 [Marinobacter sp.]|uniref:hypothetical protein n=1 Tax=Marinobacter sp. TaxID=50741 RepID=UPI0034A06F7B
MRAKLAQIVREEKFRKKRMAKVQRRRHLAPLYRKMDNQGVVVGELCALCGVNQASTRDHVPPKAIFPKPWPALITVPACFECNNSASDLDDLFKVYLSMHTAGNNEIARQLFTEKTVRTLRRNQNLLQRIHKESRRVPIRNKQGELESRLGVLWDSNAHTEVIGRTIRGLYFHHSGSPLPSDCELKVQWLRGVPEEIVPKLPLFEEQVIGENQVVYKYAIAPEDPRHSLWLFEFYGAHWASGYTSQA